MRLFRMRGQYECDLLSGEDAMTMRVELLRDCERPVYRARFWRMEHVRVQPTFPMGEDGRPQDEPGDELILAESAFMLDGDWDEFEADNDEAALEKVLGAVQRWVDHPTGV
jgi:hypothetical protein